MPLTGGNTYDEGAALICDVRLASEKGFATGGLYAWDAGGMC